MPFGTWLPSCSWISFSSLIPALVEPAVNLQVSAHDTCQVLASRLNYGILLLVPTSWLENKVEGILPRRAHDWGQLPSTLCKRKPFFVKPLVSPFCFYRAIASLTWYNIPSAVSLHLHLPLLTCHLRLPLYFPSGQSLSCIVCVFYLTL